MRELKFRAWVKNNKVGHELFTVVMISWIGKEVILSGKGGSIGLDDCVLMQYTGLKDTHGKDIYEGDILHLPTYSDWLVIWYESGFYLQIINGLGSGDKYSLTQSACNTRKVIGNIYENKELLNG